MTLKGLPASHPIISKTIADKIMQLDRKMRKAETQVVTNVSGIEEIIGDLKALHTTDQELLEHIAKLESLTEAAEERVVELTKQVMALPVEAKPNESMEDWKTNGATPVMSIGHANNIVVCSCNLVNCQAEINLLIQWRWLLENHY